ncbi:MAG TPA: hypothetical protein VM183_16915 [Burkholderiales bacterium]|nr:hypothetical protein [Burkholderiales bacterium]
MKPAIAILVGCLVALPVFGKGNTSHFIDKLSCDSGPYGLKLPKTYAELRKLGPLKNERLIRDQDLGAYRARYRELVFNGLRLGVITYSDEPERYQITSAEIRSSQWKIAGPFRHGQALPAVIGDVATKTLKSTATVEFSGDEDTVRVQLVGRRVAALTYLCVPD